MGLVVAHLKNILACFLLKKQVQSEPGGSSSEAEEVEEGMAVEEDYEMTGDVALKIRVVMTGCILKTNVIFGNF